jgi:hypothetical protein
LLCTLAEIRDNLIWAGPSFTVQVKSSPDALVFEKPHEVEWVKNLENPYFLAVGYRDELRVDIYSTWARLVAFEWKAARRIVLQPGPPARGRDLVWTAPDESNQVIALGRPVLRATVHEFMDTSRAKALSDVLRQWIKLDRLNIVNNLAGMHWVVGCQRYQTNQVFHIDTMRIFWNGKNLHACKVNFGRAATELRLTIRQALCGPRERKPKFMRTVSALDAVLREYWRELDSASQEALRQHVGLKQRSIGLRYANAAGTRRRSV